MAKAHYLFPKDYMADPAANVFNGKLYIFPSHDRESDHAFDDDGGHFQMRDYHVFRIDGDPMTCEATDCGRILDQDEVPWAEKQLWDNDAVEKNGKYYLIFSAKEPTGTFRLGVAVADKPEGPYTPQPAPIRGSFSIDPCAFKDDDGEIYVYFGGLWGGQLQWYRKPEEYTKEGIEIGNAPSLSQLMYTRPDAPALPSMVARMTDDVLQFAEAPHEVVIVDDNGEPLKAGNPYRFFEASWMHKYNGKYYFSYSTGDSHYLCYAVGDNPYGPFTFKGVILDPVEGWTTHHSIVEYQGQWYLLHHDCVPSGGKTWLRSLKIMPLSYDADGNIIRMKSE